VGGPDVREALLDAGRHVFAERGYAAASAREIVARAGVTAPALYHYFGSKAGLFAAAHSEVNDRVIGAFEEAIAGKDGLLERIDAVLDVLEEFGRADPALARFVVAAPIEFARHPELSVAAPEMGRLSKFVSRLCNTADVTGLPRRQAEGLVLTLIYGVSRMAASPGSPRHAARHVSTAVDALKTALRGQLVPE
jgi:AcrR family transcriptional regulator